MAAELVRRGAVHHSARTAVIFEDRSLTFAEVDEAANRFANVLLGAGMAKGDHLGMLMDNNLWSMSLDFACLKAGLVRVPLNSRLSVAEHRRMLEGTGTSWLLHQSELGAAAEELAASVPGIRTVGLGCPGVADGIDLLAEADTADPTDPRLPLSESDTMLLLHTSGTTGVLKAATHTQGSYAAVAANILANFLSPGPDSVMLHGASLIHASGTFVLPYWLRGGVSVVLPRFEPRGYLEAIARHRVTEVNLVPTMLGMLFAGDDIEHADVSSLRTVVYGASPMPRPLIERAIAAWGPIFKQYYGQTEVPLAITALDEADHLDPALAGSCGRPSVDMDVRVADDKGHAVSRGEIGEVQVRSPSQMAGYFRAPELNAEMITEDGWVRTRDMAHVDERGYYFLVDRRGDMIVTGGYNVYPREVEDAVAAHPAVAECAVVGAPDPLWVEAVTAFVSLRPGHSATADEIKRSVRARLAGYKVPKRVEFIETLPKSPVGKILRRALREPLWREQT
ncbi:AMP-binding protein [Streptomyces sp. NPDC002643]